METRDRSSYPDSLHSSNEHRSDWIAKPYSNKVIAIGLFILIFGMAIYLGYRQFKTTRQNSLTADRTTVNLLTDLILAHNKATIGILQSYAQRPLFINAVKSKHLAGVHRHLSDLKKNADIDLTFVTDKRGILWANFPVFPEAIGKDLSSRDWYKGVSSYWEPYISTVFKLIVGDKPLAVAVCVPIFDEMGRPIGILGSSQRLGFLVDAIERVPFSPDTTVTVIDRAGQILYSNKIPYQESITNYQFFPVIEKTLKERKQQIEINDPQKNQEKSYLTVVPTKDTGWTVITERSLRGIYYSEHRRFIEIGAISLLLFLLLTFFLVYLRKVSLFRKTEELLKSEEALQRANEYLEQRVQERTMDLKNLTEQLERSHSELRKLASELVMAEERERKRIAGVLHDDIAQNLAAARLRLGLLQGFSSDQKEKQTLEEAKALLTQSIQETRILMNDLGSPILFDMGLKQACEELAKRLMEKHSIRISYDIRDAYKQLDAAVKTILYQVVRELLNNVVKHSQAQTAHVTIDKENGYFRVQVTDDGKGFDPQMLRAPTIEGGFGLCSIRDRLIAISGSLRIESSPGTGAVVTAILPAELG